MVFQAIKNRYSIYNKNIYWMFNGKLLEYAKEKLFVGCIDLFCGSFCLENIREMYGICLLRG